MNNTTLQYSGAEVSIALVAFFPPSLYCKQLEDTVPNLQLHSCTRIQYNRTDYPIKILPPSSILVYQLQSQLNCPLPPFKSYLKVIIIHDFNCRTEKFNTYSSLTVSLVITYFKTKTEQHSLHPTSKDNYSAIQTSL